MNADRDREDCRRLVEEAVSTFHLLLQEKLSEFFYRPDDFKEPERDECMHFARGVEGARELYQTLPGFWVDALFNFFELQGFQEKFEPQAPEALCERVSEAMMRKQIRDCKERAIYNPHARGFGLRGRRLTICRMFNDEKRVSFAAETTRTFYGSSGFRVLP